MKLEYTLDNIREAAMYFLVENAGKRVFAFNGDMGAGKTTFIHALCDELQVSDVISSPTFSIINEYNYIENSEAKRIYHIDLYRLKDEDEAIQAGVEECLYSGSICFVEWPKIAPGIFPSDTLWVYIKSINTTQRLITIEDK